MAITADRLKSQHFEARHIKRLFGIDRNKLFYWSKTHGLLKPEVEEPEGTGNRAKFSTKNLVEISLVQEMLKYGFDLRTVKLIKSELDVPRDQLSGLSLIDYSLTTEYLYEYSITVLGIRQGKVSCFVNYFNPKKSDKAEHAALEVPESNASFFINLEPDPSKLARFISVKIQLGQLAHEVLTKVVEE